MTGPFVSNLLLMIDSQGEMMASIMAVAEQLVGSNVMAEQQKNLQDQHQELNTLLEKLNSRIDCAKKMLESKDPAPAETIAKARQDKFLNTLLQLHTVKQHLHTKLISHQFASERISCSIKGAFIGLSHFYLCICAVF